MDYESAIDDAFDGLLQARTRLNRAISAYPTPISGCDAQFNRLLSDRTRINQAIRAIESQPFVATPRQLEPGLAIESR